MEVIKSYAVNRIMHVRPCTEVSRAAINLYDDHPGLELLARNPQGSERGTEAVDCMLTPGILMNCIGTYDTVQIIARGDFSQEVLERCADKIGEVYSREIKEVPLGEFLFRKFHGDKKELPKDENTSP